jgi:hypothetical protein
VVYCAHLVWWDDCDDVLDREDAAKRCEVLARIEHHTEIAGQAGALTRLCRTWWGGMGVEGRVRGGGDERAERVLFEGMKTAC